MLKKHFIPVLLFCLFTFSQVAAPAFCHFTGKIHLFNSGCADDDSPLLYVNKDDGGEDALAPLVLSNYLLTGSGVELEADGLKLPGVCFAGRPALRPGAPRLYVRYRVFRI